MSFPRRAPRRCRLPRRASREDAAADVARLQHEVPAGRTINFVPVAPVLARLPEAPAARVAAQAPRRAVHDEGGRVAERRDRDPARALLVHVHVHAVASRFSRLAGDEAEDLRLASYLNLMPRHARV